MSSASKGLRRAGIGGLTALLAATAMTGLASTAQADWSAAGGQIGLVDTDTTTAGTQGATLVYPGVNGQSLGDVRLLIPNSFKNGDTIDLAIFDRTATTTTNGQINADAAHRLGFTSAPTVTVDKTPYVAATNIGPTSASANSTDGADPATAVADTSATKATTPPVFTASVVASSRANGLATDIIRLTVTGVQAAGDATNEWSVSLSDVKADLGAAVSPGELRVVPFAYNGTPASDGSNKSALFGGNVQDTDNLAGYDPTIATYTVPAYVAPVTWSVGAPNNVIADGTVQKVGDITIAETNNYSLSAGTYTIAVDGATVENGTTGDPITVTKTGGASDESVSTPAAVVGNTIQFTLTQTTTLNADRSKVSLNLSGLELSAGAQGPITYTLTGGSIDNFLASPAGSSLASQSYGDPATATTAPDAGVPADAAFSAGVNQTDIEAPALTNSSQATALPSRIGGADRYSTAAKIAMDNGDSDWVVLASGEDFPDALSSNYLASSFFTSTLLTKKNSIPASTVNAMRFMGVKTVFVVGGTGAISDAVADQLRATSQYNGDGTVTIGQGKLQVIRLGGSDRYATNRIINEYTAANTISPNPVGRTQPAFGQPTKLTALVASGDTFADALASGPATSGTYNTPSPTLSGSLPLILTRPGSLSADASSQFSALGVEHAVIVGGPAAVADGVKTAIEGAGLSTARIGGADRFETATLLADWETAPSAASASQTVGGLGFDDAATNDEWAYLANGDNFADALAGGALAGGTGSPIVLTKATTLSPATQKWLSDNAAQYSNVVGLGLGAAISSSTLNAAAAAVSGS